MLSRSSRSLDSYMGLLRVLCVIALVRFRSPANKVYCPGSLTTSSKLGPMTLCINFWDQKSRTADGGYENYPTKLLNYHIKVIPPQRSIDPLV
jgi:hypothetical protein